MYLTRAEALARNGNDWNLALPDTNIIRARAGVSIYTTLNAKEFLAERGREMFQESSRRTDLFALVINTVTFGGKNPYQSPLKRFFLSHFSKYRQVMVH